MPLPSAAFGLHPVLRPVRGKAVAARPRPTGQVRADINVTPLVDIVLVLLIIFMVVAPIIAQVVPVELPRTAHHDSKADDGKNLLVTVTSTGKVYLRTQAVSLEDLGRLVAEERQRAPGGRVYFKGDALVRYGDARRAMDALRKAHVEEILLGTEALTDARAPKP